MKTIKCKCGQDILLDDDKHTELQTNNYFHGDSTIFRHQGKVVVNMALDIIEVPLGMIPDHKDGNVHNMQRENLRPATHSQNSANRGIQINNTSGRKGIQPYKGKWMYSLMKDGKNYRKYGFKSIDEATIARDKLALELFGEFAVTYFPRSSY